MRIITVVLVVGFMAAMACCSGGGGGGGDSSKNFDTCVEKAKAKVQSEAGGNVPEAALQQAADASCQLCKQDPGGDACKAIIDNL